MKTVYVLRKKEENVVELLSSGSDSDEEASWQEKSGLRRRNASSQCEIAVVKLDEEAAGVSVDKIDLEALKFQSIEEFLVADEDQIGFLQALINDLKSQDDDLEKGISSVIIAQPVSSTYLASPVWAYIDRAMGHWVLNIILPLFVFSIIGRYDPDVLEKVFAALGPHLPKYLPLINGALSLSMAGIETLLRVIVSHETIKIGRRRFKLGCPSLIFCCCYIPRKIVPNFIQRPAINLVDKIKETLVYQKNDKLVHIPLFKPLTRPEAFWIIFFGVFLQTLEAVLKQYDPTASVEVRLHVLMGDTAYAFLGQFLLGLFISFFATLIWRKVKPPLQSTYASGVTLYQNLPSNERIVATVKSCFGSRDRGTREEREKLNLNA